MSPPLVHFKEIVLQGQCEKLLAQLGYLRLSARHAEEAHKYATHPKGWYGHLSQAKRNCFLPDLIIVSSTRPALMVELKVRPSYRPGQKEMIDMGFWKLATTLDDFMAHLSRWERA